MRRRGVLLDSDAKEDLRHLHLWISQRGAPISGRRYVLRITAFALSLDLAPERGMDLAYIRPGLRAIPFESVVLAIFVEHDAVVVLRVFHSSQDWLKDLRDRYSSDASD